MDEKPIRLLIIEDDQLECEQFMDAMKTLGGFELLGCTGSESEALELLSENTADAIILDLELAEGDGIAFLDKMWDVCNVKPFIVAATNNASIQIHNMIRSMGVDFVYQKRTLNYGCKKVLDIIKKTSRFVAAEHRMLGTEPKTSTEEEINNVKCEVALELRKYDIKAPLKGYDLLRDAVAYAVVMEGGDVRVTKVIYPKLASVYNCSVNNVERNIRSAIEHAWSVTPAKTLEMLYPYPVKESMGRPTNTSFIAFLVTKFSYKSGQGI